MYHAKVVNVTWNVCIIRKHLNNHHPCIVSKTQALKIKQILHCLITAACCKPSCLLFIDTMSQPESMTLWHYEIYHEKKSCDGRYLHGSRKYYPILAPIRGFFVSKKQIYPQCFRNPSIQLYTRCVAWFLEGHVTESDFRNRKTLYNCSSIAVITLPP